YQPDLDQQIVHQPVLGEEGAQDLADDDEGNEQRPAIEPAQDGDGARVFAQHQIAADGDGKQADERGRQRYDHHREDDVGRVEFEGFDEVAKTESILDPERADRGGGERDDEQK